jgi:hypothetical protein
MDLAADSRDETLRRLLAYWQERRGARRFPARGDVDPVEFRYALGHVSMVDVVGDPPRFRFRLVSTLASAILLLRGLRVFVVQAFFTSRPAPQRHNGAAYKRGAACAASDGH